MYIFVLFKGEDIMSTVMLKGAPISVYGDFIATGVVAPEFVLVNGQLQNVNLSDFKGKKKIISIVPSLDTPTCQISTRKFNEYVSKQNNAVLMVVSADLPFAQGRFCSTEGLSNVLALSMMRNRDFARDYGVLITDGPLKGITTRAIVVLSEDNIVLYSELVAEIADEPNYAAAIAALG